VADTQTDIRDLILAWLDEAGHEVNCANWESLGGAPCDCLMGPLVATVRAVLDLHAPHGTEWTPCRECGRASLPCPTVKSVADALGVTP
jgi:hypothetical protein